MTKRKNQCEGNAGMVFLPSKNWFVLAATILVFVVIIEKESALGYSYEDVCPTCPTDDLYNKERLGILDEMPIRIWTDRTLYLQGSDISVSGKVANLKPDFPITVTIFNPQTNMIHADQIQVSEDNTFETTINTSGDLWDTSGLYTIRAQYGSQEVNDRATIEIIGNPKNVDICSENQFEVKSNTASYCIPYKASDITVKSALVDGKSYSMVLTLDAQVEDTMTIMIPRNILDSKAGSSDTPFVVEANGQPVINVFEINSNENTRTIEITVPEGTSELEIMGTFAIPEFGEIVVIILVTAIISVIAISKTNIIQISRYK